MFWMTSTYSVNTRGPLFPALSLRYFSVVCLCGGWFLLMTAGWRCCVVLAAASSCWALLSTIGRC